MGLGKLVSAWLASNSVGWLQPEGARVARLVGWVGRLPACWATWQRCGERSHAQLDGLQCLLPAVALAC